MTTWMDFRGPSFNMQVPSDWYITSNLQFQALFVGPEIEATGTQPNVSITMRPVKEEVTVSAVAEQTRTAQAENYAAYTVLAEHDFSEQGTAFIRRYTWHNEERDMTIQQLQMFVVHDNFLYTVTGTTPTEPPEELDAIINKMIDSFVVVVN